MDSTERKIRRNLEFEKEDILELVEDYPLVALFIAIGNGYTNGILQKMKRLIEAGEEMRCLLQDLNQQIEEKHIVSICRDSELHKQIVKRIDPRSNL